MLKKYSKQIGSREYLSENISIIIIFELGKQTADLLSTYLTIMFDPAPSPRPIQYLIRS